MQYWVIEEVPIITGPMHSQFDEYLYPFDEPPAAALDILEYGVL